MSAFPASHAESYILAMLRQRHVLTLIAASAPRRQWLTTASLGPSSTSRACAQHSKGSLSTTIIQQQANAAPGRSTARAPANQWVTVLQQSAEKQALRAGCPGRNAQHSCCQRRQPSLHASRHMSQSTACRMGRPSERSKGEDPRIIKDVGQRCCQRPVPRYLDCPAAPRQPRRA
jgi:hypothetical protein